jgi:tRNA-dihydrouridine synthase 1
VLLDAAKRVEDRCDAVDINFGCPQGIAKKGRYGSFLQDEWELIHKLISTLHENLKVPVTAKFRVFPDVEKTVRYAKMMEAAGAQIITCHGRTRDMKGQKTGLADWEQIKAVKAAVKIPVFANGNILYSDDVDACIEQTGVDGVMSAEGNLSNPAIFMPQDHALAYPSSILLALRYLDIVDGLKTRTAGSAVKAHMFRLLKPLLADDEDLRQIIARTGLAPEGRTDRYREALNTIAARLGHPGDSVPVPTRDEHGYRALPPHIAQPYIRKRPISSETALGEDGEAVPSTAGPSRVASPAPDAEGAAEAEGSGPAIAGRVIGGMDEMCVGTDCPGTAATRCPTRACLLHCREVRAVAAGMDPAAAAKAAAAGGLVGHGCDAHEAKHIARQQRRQEKNAARSQARAIKREETRVKQVEREEERRAEREERQRLKAEKESQKRKRSASPGGEGEHKAKASKEDAEEAVVNGMSEKATAAADAVAA